MDELVKPDSPSAHAGREAVAPSSTQAPSPNDGTMRSLIESKDFASTKLGPRGSWPQSLKTALSICVSSRFPMVIFWGADLCVLYNDGYIPIFAQKHPDVLGKTGFEAWGEVWDVIGPMLDAVMTRGEATWSKDQLLILERNGYPEECYFTWSYSPISDETGGVGGVLTVIVETTERVLGERRLLTLRELGEAVPTAKDTTTACRIALRTMYGNPHDVPFALIYLLDEAGEQLDLACHEGLDDHEVARPGRVSTSDTSSWPLGLVVTIGELTIVDLNTKIGPLPGGAWPEATTTAVAVPIAGTDASHPFGVLVVGISPRLDLDDAYLSFLKLASNHVASALSNARSHQEERKRAEALAELDRAKTAFFSNVSHEFRTPLTLMLGPQEDALGSPEHALSGDALDSVHRNTLRLLKLVNTLLDFSRIEAGRAQASYEATDLATVTRELASAFESAIERGGLRFEIDCAPLAEPVYVDREMWEKIVLNLLSNALKFTFEGLIRVALRSAGDHVELSVTDTGVGIPAQMLPRVFERFHRIEGTRSRTHEGSGIGLALVHDLVKLHGGEIQVASQVDHGTTFTVSIPTGSAHLPAERVDASRSLVTTAVGARSFVVEALRWLPAPAGEATKSSLPTASPSELPPEITMQPARVLVADDNADMREYVTRLLRQQQWTVQTVSDGVQALAAVRETRPDLILTDVMMPNLDGFGLLQALRDDPSTSTIPVIMLSARAGEESRVEGLHAGADDYLVKPFSAKELVARVATHLQLARLRVEAAAAGIRLHALLMQAPVAVAILTGPEHRYELANPRYLEMLQKTDLVGKTVAQVFPELVGTPALELLDNVFRTGEPFVADEYPVTINRGGTLEECAFKFDLVATRDPAGAITGMFASAVEITEQVRARRAIEVSEARFRRIFESNMIGFVFTDLDGRVLDANDYFLRMLGLSRDDLRDPGSGRTSEHLPDTRDATRHALLALRTNGVCPPLETEYIRTDGSRVPVVIGSTLLPGRGNEAVTFALDISDRKRIEQQLAFLSEASKAIASPLDHVSSLQAVALLSSPILGDWCGMYLVSDTGALSVVASHHVDDERGALAHRSVATFVVDPDAFYGAGYVVRTGQPQLIREVTPNIRAQVTPDPEQLALVERLGITSSIVVPLFGEEGRVIGVLSFDITESARRFDEIDLRLAEELGRRVSLAIEAARLYRDRVGLLEREQTARADAESANHAKDEFLAMLGHELRNPLAPILTALHLMRLRGADTVEKERAVIERQAQHLVRLVDDLLDVSRITKGKVELKKQRIELAAVVANAIEMASPLLEQRKHDLDVRVPKRGLAVEADPARLAQVISNLVTNAAKYTESGGQITITADRTGDQVGLKVRDNGIGIAPEMLPRVFEMFVQERQALDRSQGGLGLGLSIVSSLMALHGGTVEVRSDGRNRGSEFAIRLPAAVAQAEPVVGSDSVERLAAILGRGERDGRRILVVDDNEDAADLLAQVLETMGNMTRIAHDGPAALRIADEFAPDVALLDIGLPVMDGYELARRLRAQPGRDGLHLVAVTGYGQDNDKRAAKEAGFDAHLVKPVNIDRLKDLIRELATRRRQEPELSG